MASKIDYDLNYFELFWTESAKRGVPDIMIYDVSGTPFCKPAFSPLAQRKVDILKSKKRVPKVLRFTMFAELFSAKSSKRGAPNIMFYDVFGTPFWKVEMLTWCHGIPSFPNVKNGVSETL